MLNLDACSGILDYVSNSPGQEVGGGRGCVKYLFSTIQILMELISAYHNITGTFKGNGCVLLTGVCGAEKNS